MNPIEVYKGIQKVREQIITSYTPEPKLIHIWFDANDGTFKSLTKFEHTDLEIILTIWDINDFEIISEVIINDYTLHRINEYF